MKLLSAVLFFTSLAFSQTANKVAPDCDIPFTLTGAGSSSTAAGSCAQNLQGVRFWSVIYQSNGFSGLTLTMQEAPDSNGVPGSWSTFTAASGTNPMTSTTGVNADTTYLDYAPWVRVTLSGLSGSGKVTGHIYGSKLPGSGSGGSGGGGGGGGSGCVGTIATPCQIGVDNNGSLLPALGDSTGKILNGAYPTIAAVSLSSSGLTQIIAASSGNTTTIAHYSISFASSVSFQLEYGTGTNCGTGTTAITGVYQPLTAIAIDVPFQVPASKAVCANLGAGVTGGGSIVFSQP
jgi:hypothetical protein